MITYVISSWTILPRYLSLQFSVSDLDNFLAAYPDSPRGGMSSGANRKGRALVMTIYFILYHFGALSSLGQSGPPTSLLAGLCMSSYINVNCHINRKRSTLSYSNSNKGDVMSFQNFDL